MTNTELIAKIKSEIERLIEESDFDESANLYSLLSFLDTLEEDRPEPYNPVYDEAYLNEKIKKATESWKGVDVDAMLAECRGYDEEKSEKPMNQEGLEEEIARTYNDGSVTDTSDIDHVSYENIAEYFYDLGCRRTAEKYDEIEYNRQRAEESEKPMVQEELEKEINRYLREECSDDDEPGIHEIAEHFAEWGYLRAAEKYNEIEYNRQRAEESVPKDLEEASSKFATHTAYNGVSVEFLYEKLSFQEGAKWQKEQIMKNAKDGWIDEECVIVLNDGTRVDLQPDYEKNPAFEFEYAQDVRVIVLPKEDSHDTRRKE